MWVAPVFAPGFVIDRLASFNALRLPTVENFHVAFAKSTVMCSPLFSVTTLPLADAPSVIEVRVEAPAAPATSEPSVIASALTIVRSVRVDRRSESAREFRPFHDCSFIAIVSFLDGIPDYTIGLFRPIERLTSSGATGLHCVRGVELGTPL